MCCMLSIYSKCKIKRGLINYRIANGIFALRKHLEGNHQELWSEWTKHHKDGFEGEKNPTKKRYSLAPNIISTYLGSYVPY